MGNPVTVERFLEEVQSIYEQRPRMTYQVGCVGPKKIDCRGVILLGVRNAGYERFRFGTTNEFWDDFCEWKGTPEEAKALGYWHPGLILFHLDEATNRTTHMGVLTERQPAQYPDIEGRASGDVINSSESKDGMILSDTKDRYYNRCALALQKVIDYSAWFSGDGADAQDDQDEQPGGDAMEEGLYQAVVRTDETGLNFRRSPSKEAGRVVGMKIIPRSAMVDVLEEVSAEWAKVAYKGYTGYAARAFLERTGGSVSDESGFIVEIYGFRDGAMDNDDAIAILAVAEKMGYAGTIRAAGDD